MQRRDVVVVDEQAVPESTYRAVMSDIRGVMSDMQKRDVGVVDEQPTCRGVMSDVRGVMCDARRLAEA
jgi:hypothetical protein